MTRIHSSNSYGVALL
uniref:Uncharacterized protein n=1 Tax=Arundo donax TaxID=35708 RepID=A0A0A9EME4_ARUDO